MTRKKLTVEEGGARLDVYLALRVPDMTRSRIQKLAEEGRILVGGKHAKSSHKVAEGESIELEVPDPIPVTVEAEDIPLDVVYEDSDLIVVNKPRGMVVHPAAGNHSGTLVHALLYHCKDLSGIGGELRPGIVHRIDKDTTGLIVAAKNDKAHRSLAAQIKRHSAGRVYLALVEGVIREDGQVNAPIARDPRQRKKMAVVDGGREALTHYRVLERFAHETLVECRLETGRTHQIRVHMAHIGHPVVGDPLYGFKKQRYHVDGQLLHAAGLHFVHPRTGEAMSFEAPLPEDFSEILCALRAKTTRDSRII